MKIGCCISVKHVLLAKAFGYDFIELSANELMSYDEEEWAYIRQQIRDAHIPVIGFNSFCDEKHPIVGPNADMKQLQIYLHTVIHRAYELNCKNIGIGAPKARSLPENFDYEVAQEQMKEFLCLASKMSSQYGIHILYEAIHPKSCNFCNSTTEAANMVRELNLPNVKLVWDVYHSINAMETYEQIAPLFDIIEHVHICSWDKALHRFYLLEKDEHYVKDLTAFLQNQHYQHTLSIEASDNDFERAGKTAIEMLNVYQLS